MPLRPPAGFISAFYDPLKVADAPTIGTATAGDASASVTFTAPTNTGGAAITQYYAVSNPDQITGNAASSPVTVSGLTNGTSYTFTVWALNSYGPSPYSAASGSVTPAAARGVFGGGLISSVTADMDYITIGSTGNSIDFGTLTQARQGIGACASSTRGIFAGGETNITYSNVIDYITILTTGNATDFGDLTQARRDIAGCSSETRGLFGGGSPGGLVNTIDYITIASAGNATDFGDLTIAVGSGGAYAGACASSTRGLFAGGSDVNTVQVNVIGYVTIASAGNATDFGDLTVARGGLAGCSNATRGIFGGGVTTNVMDYVTIASAGNATDFGDLTAATPYLAACSNAHGGL